MSSPPFSNAGRTPRTDISFTAPFTIVAGTRPSAIESLERARVTRPNDPDVLIYLSVTATGCSGRFEPALESIVQALAVDPLNPVNWNMSGQVRWFAGDIPAAIADFHRGVALGNDTPMCHASLAAALMVDGRDDEAGVIFGDLVRRFPDDPYVHLWRLVWFGRRGDKDAVRSGFTAEAMRSRKWTRAAPTWPPRPVPWSGDRDGALRWFRHMIRDRGFVAWPYFSERDPFLVGTARGCGVRGVARRDEGAMGRRG